MAALVSRVELELERRDEARGAEHAQAVLREALVRVADRAEHAAREIAAAVERVDELRVDGVDGDRVDREVAPREVGRDVVDELDPVGPAPVGVRPLAAQRRDLVVAARRCTTVTVPCSIPVGMARGKIASSSFGRASVATSQSAATRPSSRSRTQPPTIQRALALRAQPLAEIDHVARNVAMSARSMAAPSRHAPRGCDAVPNRRNTGRILDQLAFSPEPAEPPWPARLMAQARGCSTPLLDFSEEHKLAAQLIRTWCTTRLGPAVVELEEGKTPPYALMRELCATFGIADTVRAFAESAAVRRRGDGDAWRAEGDRGEGAGTKGRSWPS